jgi:ParB/RepB/Spo0J family partition protein
MSNNKNQIPQVVGIPTDLIHEPEWNPNEQIPEVFNQLVETIKEVGLIDPVIVVPRSDKKGEYWSISGSHRVKAARVLGIDVVPCIVREDWDEDVQKFQNMRFNMIRGKLDPIKFTRMFNELAKKYGEEVTRKMMAFVDRAAFDAVYQKAKESLPPEMQKELDKARDEVKTIDGLAAILNEMFKKYGGTLDNGYMVFTYGGQTHLWIVMDDETKRFVDAMKKTALETGKNINEVFRSMLMNRATMN